MGQQPPTPPSDPEEWTDEQWLEWLRETDAEYAETTPQPPATPTWRDRTPARLLGAAMLGVHDAIYGHLGDEPVVVGEAPGGPPDDDRPEVLLDPDHPERSQVIIRTRQPTNDTENLNRTQS